MDRKPDAQTMSLLKEQLKTIKKEFSPEKIILFGSRARGDHLADSDVDLMIVSEAFAGIPWRERTIRAFGSWDKKQMLQPICYTRQEFERLKNRIGIVQQAAREGIELA
jgi:hypothetical protein